VFTACLPRLLHAVDLQNCSYMITVSGQESLTHLIDGVPVGGTVPPHQFDEYMITVNTSAPVTVALTVVAGDPDVYINTDNNNLPNNTYYQWAMLSLASETLILQPGDYLPLCGGRPPCNLYFAVTGFLNEASYTLLVSTTGPGGVMRILDGQPQVRDTSSVDLLLLFAV
jgi:hypothetical protein